MSLIAEHGIKKLNSRYQFWKIAIWCLLMWWAYSDMKVALEIRFNRIWGLHTNPDKASDRIASKETEIQFPMKDLKLKKKPISNVSLSQKYFWLDSHSITSFESSPAQYQSLATHTHTTKRLKWKDTPNKAFYNTKNNLLLDKCLPKNPQGKPVCIHSVNSLANKEKLRT